MYGRPRVVPRKLVDFGQSRCWRIRSGIQSNDGPREAQHCSPNRAIHRTNSHPIKGGVDALVLGGINRLIRLNIFVAFAIPVRVQNQRCPALRRFLVVRFIEPFGVQPSYGSKTLGSGCPGFSRLSTLGPAHRTSGCARWLGYAKWAHLPSRGTVRQPRHRRSSECAGHEPAISLGLTWNSPGQGQVGNLC